MIDIEKQIRYWREGSLEEWQVTKDLLAKKHVRQALFWAHLTLEKMLKAHVCKHTRDLAPRSHNLAHLGHLAELDLTPEQIKFLLTMNEFNMEGRYPEHQPPIPEANEVKDMMRHSEELLTWLTKKL